MMITLADLKKCLNTDAEYNLGPASRTVSPPRPELKEGDIWWTKIPGVPEVQHAEIYEMTKHTVRLNMGPYGTARYKISDVEFVEKVEGIT